jgi:hypothetical protein
MGKGEGRGCRPSMELWRLWVLCEITGGGCGWGGTG